MQKPIDIAESIGLMLTADSYLIGANYTTLRDTVLNYDDTLNYLKQRSDLFKLYPCNGYTAIMCDSNWLYSKYSLVDETINYKELYTNRLQKNTKQLNLLLRKFINGQAYNSYIDKENDFIELKFGIQNITKRNQVLYHKTKLYSFALSIIDTLNTVSKAQQALGVRFYIRINENGEIKYRDLISTIKDDNTLNTIMSATELHTSDTCMIVTLRVLLSDLEIKHIKSGLVK